MKFSVLVSFFCLFVVSSCAMPKPQTIDELTSLRDERLDASVHKFYNVTKGDVEKAIVKVLQLHDGDDYIFDVRDGRILASRGWSLYYVFTVSSGREYWEFIFEENNNYIQVNTALTQDINHGLPAYNSTRFKEDINISGDRLSGGTILDYNLLYERVEFLLGNRDTWPTCKEAKKNIPENEWNLIILCDQPMINDRSPNYQAKKQL